MIKSTLTDKEIYDCFEFCYDAEDSSTRGLVDAAATKERERIIAEIEILKENGANINGIILHLKERFP
jgi:hypothetical protein